MLSVCISEQTHIITNDYYSAAQQLVKCLVCDVQERPDKDPAVAG